MSPEIGLEFEIEVISVARVGSLSVEIKSDDY